MLANTWHRRTQCKVVVVTTVAGSGSGWAKTVSQRGGDPRGRLYWCSYSETEQVFECFIGRCICMVIWGLVIQ